MAIWPLWRPGEKAQGAALREAPSPFEWRGIVEGFYGTPWTHAQRLDMLDFMAAQGLNAYIYAPKNDPFHRSKWREPYPAPEIRRLSELAGRARERGITTCAAVSPGLSLRYSDPADRRRLVQKYHQLADAGFTTFALFLDDIPPRLEHPEDRAAFASLAAAQVDLVSFLLEELGVKRAPRPAGQHSASGPQQGPGLWLCPTQYHGDPDTPYLHELAESLPDEVEVFWTGPEVCSGEVPTGYMRRVAEVLGRRPLLWDNYPVNDAFMAPEIHLGPYQGRGPDLYTVVRGVFLNPMNQAEASKIALATAASFLNAPRAYEPELAWKAALVGICGGQHEEALRRFALANSISPLTPGDPAYLGERLDQARSLLWAMRFDEGLAALEGIFGEMNGVAGAILRLPNAALARELGPWVDDYRFWALVGTRTARVYRLALGLGEAKGVMAQLRGLLRLETELERLRLDLRRAADRRTRACGDAVMKAGLEAYRQIRGVLSQLAPIGPAVSGVLALYRAVAARLPAGRQGG